MNGMKYLMNQKSEKAIQCFEIAYQISIENGELDNAMFTLRILEDLYNEFGCSKRIKRIYELLNEFYKISHSKIEIGVLDLSIE